MFMEIVDCEDKDKLLCAGSFTKLLTTYCLLSFLSESYNLDLILDDENFFNKIATPLFAKNFLSLFQRKIKNKFTLRDTLTFFTGLPYTFDVSKKEIEYVELNHPFKHHSILDEKLFLEMCNTNITMLYPNRSKFHYSELSIIFLAYLLERIFNFKIETLYQQYVIDKFQLKNSLFSRLKPSKASYQDLSYKYDYPSIAILDHGYFCYSNGFYTTMRDMEILLSMLLADSIFIRYMADIQHARAVSPTIMNGLTVEIRKVGDDILYGYEGLSFSGCNLWCYSTKLKKGYLTFTRDEEEAYKLYHLFGYTQFDPVALHTSHIYRHFLKHYHPLYEVIAIPLIYQGKYQRVDINDSHLQILFTVADYFIIIRNPTEIKYEIIYLKGHYHVKGKDGLPSMKVGFITSSNQHHYMYVDGTLYKKLLT